MGSWESQLPFLASYARFGVSRNPSSGSVYWPWKPSGWPPGKRPLASFDAAATLSYTIGNLRSYSKLLAPMSPGAMTGGVCGNSRTFGSARERPKMSFRPAVVLTR